ncbi:hypothetical protein Ciccas_002492 [Cichlidogyrus casuarinus]|uniref:Phosphatidic acid phosphatase type 2/haloperoxidase domain-containing protein n=1 Tax=Cichlidogyrus casuarinus TaxID=1844966 RepID=A0ABD2QH35_9PLAT
MAFGVHRSKFLIVGILSSILLGFCIINFGLGRMVYRINWAEDIYAGWALGLASSIYVVCCILKSFKYKEHVCCSILYSLENKIV